MALTELKGRPLGTQKVIIERGPIRVFAQALMDDDPVYTADNAPVPPTFRTGPADDDLPRARDGRENVFEQGRLIVEFGPFDRVAEVAKSEVAFGDWLVRFGSAGRVPA